ncbi:MAG: DUF998 domain-containing protein [Bacteroidetes bacterium]|nr:MAG: DUF998 domain-containing protein [Bacteroidota bacterium]
MKQKPHALAGIAAPVLFIGTYLLVTAVWPGFNHLTQPVSAIGAVKAPYGFVWNVAGCIGTGLLTAFFALGLHRAVATDTDSKLPFFGLFFSGIFMTLTGIFPEVPGQPETILHGLTLVGCLLSFLLAAFTYPALLRQSPFWNKTIVPSLILAWSCILSCFLKTPQAPGISQRAGFLFYLLWIGYLAFHLLRFEDSQHA